jgi:hypothetical protein
MRTQRSTATSQAAARKAMRNVAYFPPKNLANIDIM